MLYYCGFDSFLQFKQEKGKNNVYLQPLSDLVLDRNDNVILNAFIGWCSLFLQTGKGQILYLGYTKNRSAANVEKNDMVVCSQVPKVSLIWQNRSPVDKCNCSVYCYIKRLSASLSFLYF